MTERVVNYATFTFVRHSTQGDLPLISVLFVNSVSTGLNGTVVHCTDLTNQMTSASTTIQIIDISQSKLGTFSL